MKKNKRMYKKLMVNALVLSLIQAHTIPLSYATTPEDFETGIKIFGNISNNVLAQKNQMRMQQLAQEQAIQLQKQFTPKYGPSKYFPECQMPMAMPNLPKDVCQMSMDPAKVSLMYAYEKMSSNMMNYYDQLVNEATRVPNVGISCMQNQTKKFDDQMTEMINNLTRLQTQLKEEAQQFRENNKGLLADMETTNTELFGGDPGGEQNTVNGKTRDFTKLVSPECQRSVGSGMMGAAAEKGFNGLLQSMAPKNQSANSYMNSRGQIESELKASVQKMKDSIAADGIEAWMSPDASGTSKAQLDLAEKLSSYPSLGTIVNKEKQNLMSQSVRISKALTSLGYELPRDLGNETSSSLANMISSVQFDLKNKYVSDCTFNSTKGVALDFDKVLSSIEQLSTNNSKVALEGYKTALRNIYNSDDSLETKLQKIKDLDSSYSGISISFINFNGAKEIATPYALFNKTRENCNNKYAQYESGNSKKVESLLREYKTITDSFPGKLGNSIVNTVINCNGEALKPTDSCDENALSPAKQQNFCMAKATACATQMQSCYNELNTQVEKRKVKLNGLAQTFNNNVQTMITRSNNLFKGQLAKIESLNKMIQQRFPNSNFTIPNDMFIPLPATAKDKYGVDLAGNGDMESMTKVLPEKIESLKQMFAQQKQKSDEEIGDYIGKQKQNISEQKEKFNALYSECRGAADASTKQMDASNQAGQKAQDEMNAKVSSFCRKYDALRQSEAPACGQIDGLVESADEVASRLSKRTYGTLSAYQNYCNSYNNQKKLQDDADEACDLIDGPVVNGSTTKVPKNKAKCDKLNRQLAKLGKKPKSSKKPDLNKLCPSENTSDQDFVSNIVKNLKQADYDRLPGIVDEKKLDRTAIVNALKDGNFSAFADEENPLSELRTRLNLKDGNFCKDLKQRVTKATDAEKKEADDKIARLTTVRDQAKKDKEAGVIDKAKQEAVDKLNSAKKEAVSNRDKATAALSALEKKGGKKSKALKSAESKLKNIQEKISAINLLNKAQGDVPKILYPKEFNSAAAKQKKRDNQPVLFSDLDETDKNNFNTQLQKLKTEEDKAKKQLDKVRGKSNSASAEELTNARAEIDRINLVIAELDRKIKEATEQLKPDDQALNKALSDAEAALKNAEEEKAKLDKKGEDEGVMNTQIAEAILGDEADEDELDLGWSKLGEQATESCDAESSVQMNKNPLFFDINSYDKSKLSGGAGM